MAEEKWKGKTTAEVKGKTADQVWSLLADFCNLQKCMPNVHQCIKLEGEDGKPGLVRHICHSVTTTTTTEEEEEEALSVSVDKEQAVSPVKKHVGGIWADEKLVLIDETQRFLSYELVDNNIGMKSYEAAFKAVEVEVEVEAGDGDGDGDGEGKVCRIEWSYVADPIQGVKIEDFEVTRAYLLHAMVEMIQAHDFSLPLPLVHSDRGGEEKEKFGDDNLVGMSNICPVF